jgi:hypothetical protein
MKSKGNYYKIKTKRWFEEKGYLCEYLEKLQRIVTKDKKSGNEKIIWIKRDLFYSDGIAILPDKEIIFWNSKFGKSNIAEGFKNYNNLKLPKIPQIKKWLVVWEVRKQEPEIIECE